MLRLLGYALLYVAPVTVLAIFAYNYTESVVVTSGLVLLYAICVCLVEAGVALIYLEDEIKEWGDY